MAHEMIYKHYLDNIQVKFLMGKTSEYFPGWSSTDASSEYNKLYYVAEGELKVEVGDHTFIAHGGDLVLLPKGTKQTLQFTGVDPHLIFHWVHFTATCNDMDLFELIKLPHKIYIAYNPEIMELIMSIPLLDRNHDIVSVLKQKSALLQLITYYINASSSVIRYENYDERIEQIVNYIQSNLANDITVTELAALSHLHPNYFIRFFKHQTGFAPMNFISDMRINRAKELLRNTDYPIGEIAVMVGITDYSYFSRQFKRSTSFSPSEYRQLMQNSEIKNPSDTAE